MSRARSLRGSGCTWRISCVGVTKSGGRSAEGTPTLPNLAQQEIMEHDSRITQLRNGWIVDQ